MPRRRRAAAAPAPALALLVFLAAAGLAHGANCGPKAGNAQCAAGQCCSIYGYCGKGARFCAKDRCYSGACEGSTQQGPAPSRYPQAPFYSLLWGQRGERWSPAGRLPDLSYAGYAGNERGIPSSRYTRVFNARNFGAKGDGITGKGGVANGDDTAAIQRAIQAASEAAAELGSRPCGKRRCVIDDHGWGNEGAKGTVVFLPRGVFRVTQTLEITQSNVVLRGAGVRETRLFFPLGLQAVYGKGSWATGGAFIIIDGNNPGGNQDGYALAKLTVDARKGARRIYVDSTADISVGQWVRLFALAPSPPGGGAGSAATGAGIPRPTNSTSGAPGGGNGTLPLTAVLQRQMASAALYALAELAEDGVQAAAAPGTLDAYLYGDVRSIDSGTWAFEGTDHIRFPSRVRAVGKNYIDLERPLPYDLRKRWDVWVYQFQASVQHSGIERLTVHFAYDVYPEHLRSRGYNAIALTGVANCWVNMVNIINADNGIQITKADFVTVHGVALSVARPRFTKKTWGDNGHHALWVKQSGDVALFGFNIMARYMHDLSVDGFAERTVFANGRGVNMNIDCHRAGPHNHLFSNLEMGLGRRPFKSGGDVGRGAHSGANVTFWNLHFAGGRGRPWLPDCDFGPMQNFVGLYQPPEELDPPLPWDQPIARFPRWCSQTRWYVEQVPPRQRLYPQDLFSAMVATRRQRLRV